MIKVVTLSVVKLMCISSVYAVLAKQLYNDKLIDYESDCLMHSVTEDLPFRGLERYQRVSKRFETEASAQFGRLLRPRPGIEECSLFVNFER